MIPRRLVKEAAVNIGRCGHEKSPAAKRQGFYVCIRGRYFATTQTFTSAVTEEWTFTGTW